MSGSLPPIRLNYEESQRSNLPFWTVLSGLAIMYAPVYLAAVSGIWKDDNYAHGAIVLAVVFWLFWESRKVLFNCPIDPSPALGWPTFVIGILAYITGRVVGISIFEFGSQPLVIIGVILLTRGSKSIRVLWFPIVYMLFMIPLPGMAVDALTGPLKGWISRAVVDILHLFGYPIARSGVTIAIGQYQMLVADACSGLHSMFSLTALGTLFMYIVGRKEIPHNLLMLVAIVPIAFAANIVRVIFLILITYHFGDDAGQGFLHGAAGMVLMLAALGAFVSLDGFLRIIFPTKQKI